MFEALQYEFMRHAVLAGVLAAVGCGVIGVFVVANRIVFISGGVAHAAYGGIGLAVFLGIAPLWGILAFSLAAALVMASVSLRLRHRADAVIGVIWALGMALGIVLLDLTPGYRADLMSYLFGSILAVPSRDLYMMLGLDALVILAVGYFYHDLVAISYDDEFARVRGVPVTGLYYLLMILIAVTVVMLIQVVGMILVIAMLTIPPFIAEKMVRSMGRMIGLSVLLNLGFTLAGLALAYAYDLTSGAAIILVAASCFFLTLGVQRIRGR